MSCLQGNQLRKTEMHTLHFEEGWTFQEIGNKYGISRERVRQIIGNSNNARAKRTKIEVEKIGADSVWKKTSQLKSNTSKLLKTIINKKVATVHHLPDNIDTVLGRGIIGENRVSEILLNNGVSNQLMPFGYKFDILCEGGIRVDVKTATKSHLFSPSAKTGMYRFRIRKNIKKDCDFFIFWVPLEEKLWIVPEHHLPDVDSVYISENINSKSWNKTERWKQWEKRFDLLK